MIKLTTLPQLVQFVENHYNNPKQLNFLQNGKWQHISSSEFAYKIKSLALALNHSDSNKMLN